MKLKKSLFLTLWLLIATVLSACGQQKSVKEGTLPTLIPTLTVAPHVTSTPLPAIDVPDVMTVDWNDISAQAGAMRADYVSDVEHFKDGNRYYIEASVELGEIAATIQGTQVVRFVNSTPDTLHEVMFRLYPNLTALAGRMRVNDVKVNGVVVEPSYLERDTAMSVPLSEPLAVGDSIEISMDFITVAERGMNASYGRFGFQQNLLAAPGWHPMLSVYEKDKGGWWTQRANPQGDPEYGETTLYEVYLTHAEKLVIAMSGVTIEKTDNGDGTVTEHVTSGPMRFSIILASPDMGKVSGEVDGTTVNVYYMPGGERGAEWGLQVGLDSVRIFNEQFGDYPFAEVDIAETFTRAGGVENPGLVVINDLLWNAGSVGMENVVAHEVAHQWWYSLVGNDQVNHPWLDESLTSYSENFYWRYAYNDENERANEDIQNARAIYNGYRGSVGAVDLPMNLPVASYNNRQYGPIIYVKGTVFFSELEELIGPEAFSRGIKAYFADMKYKVSTSYAILRHMEEASGQDLDAFFYEWLGDFEGLDPEVKAQVDAENERTE